MGCDIHGWVEYNIGNAECPYFMEFAQFTGLSRCYNVFCELAGVRDYQREGVTVGTAVGLPPNCDKGIRQSIDDNPDYHTPSYCRVDLLQTIIQKHCPHEPTYLAVIACMIALGPSARFIFCFDN